MEKIDKIKTARLYCGPMSKNIVNAIIKFSKNTGVPIGLIASRRQIDNTGGYVNNWTTKTFTEYVRGKTDNIILCRDHGGPWQGRHKEAGVDSLLVDAEYMDVIHIDPFKTMDLYDSVKYIIRVANECLDINPACLFEVGTEEAILRMFPGDIEYILSTIRKLDRRVFDAIIFCVIQSGTKIGDGGNIGKYDRARLIDMISVCNAYGVMSKEHNGDYLRPGLISTKFSDGLSAINIAPEIANMEASYILMKLPKNKVDSWFELCINEGSWKKWFFYGFNPAENKNKVLALCGHYVFSNKDFVDVFNLDDASEFVETAVDHFIRERCL